MKKLVLGTIGIAVLNQTCSYLLKRTEKIAANSTSELIVWGFRRLFKKKESEVMFLKEIDLGQLGKLTITESAGVVTASLSASVNAGGGSMHGIAAASVSASVQLSAKQLIDAGLDLAIAKYPGAASILEAAKAGIDAELAKA